MRSGIREKQPEVMKAAGCCGRAAGSSANEAARQAACACTEAFMQNSSYASAAARVSACESARDEPAGCENRRAACLGGSQTSRALPVKTLALLRLRRGAVLLLPVFMKAGIGWCRCRAGLKPGLRGAACRSRAETRPLRLFKLKRRLNAGLTACGRLRTAGAGHGF